MSDNSTAVLEHALEADLFTRYPLEAAGLLEPMSPAAIAENLAGHDAKTLAPVFEAMSPAILPGVISRLSNELVAATLNRNPDKVLPQNLAFSNHQQPCLICDAFPCLNELV